MASPSSNGNGSDPANTAGCGRLVCLEEGCTRPPWSGGLCRIHYQRTVRSFHAGQDAGHSQPSNGSGYDVRFCNLFTSELEQRGYPCYPEPHWFGALARADAGFQDLGPPISLSKPQLCATQANAVVGTREPGPLQMFRSDGRDDIGKEVNAACTRWLSQRGIESPRLY